MEPRKNEALKIERRISFEEFVLAIETDGLLDQIRHPSSEKYPNQSVLVVAIDGYSGVSIGEGIPYQTLIASLLHEYVTGRLLEKASNLFPYSTVRADKRRSGLAGTL